MKEFTGSINVELPPQSSHEAAAENFIDALRDVLDAGTLRVVIKDDHTGEEKTFEYTCKYLAGACDIGAWAFKEVT